MAEETSKKTKHERFDPKQARDFPVNPDGTTNTAQVDKDSQKIYDALEKAIKDLEKS